MKIRPIEGITVYGPEEDGIDYDIFCNLQELSKKYGDKVAVELMDLFNKRVLDSYVGNGLTLDKYLSIYFEQTDKYSASFINRRFFRSYDETEHPSKDEIISISEKYNALYFIYPKTLFNRKR